MRFEDFFGYKNPHLLKEWDFDKNKERDPYSYNTTSTISVWWKCERGHSWKAPIHLRVQGLMSCQVCRSFAFLDPALLKDWDYERNSYEPFSIKVNSSKNVHWKCSHCGHNWELSPIKRQNKPSRNCPSCNARIPLPTDSIVYDNFNLYKMWDSLLNKNKSAYEVSTLDKEVYVWKCNKNHIFKGTVQSAKYDGCPMCKKDRNLMVNLMPSLLMSWDYDKNKNIDVFQVNYYSKDIYGWKCEEGHEWKCSPYEMGVEGKVCPECNLKETISVFSRVSGKSSDYISSLLGAREIENGLVFNDTANGHATNSYALWDEEKNESAFDLKKIKNRRHWFHCEKGHSFKSKYSTYRVSCHECHLKKETLKRKYPYIFKHIEMDLNDGVNLDNLKYYNNSLLWFRCSENPEHVWQSAIIGSTHAGVMDCPYCDHRLASRDNTLNITHPEIAKEWNYEKNGDLTPDKITFKYDKKVHWKSKEGVDLEAKVLTYIKNSHTKA